MPRDVPPERSGWRDEALSLRRRSWGFDCPATDVDYLEYHHGKPVALFEWKHERARRYDPNCANMRALRGLADLAMLPLFVVIRADDFSRFEVRPENWCARLRFKEANVRGPAIFLESEARFVRMLYWLRGLPMPADARLATA